MTETSQPTFKGFLQASGHAKIWNGTDDKKLQQLSWGTTTNEGCYSTNTALIGNWNEDRFDIKEMAKSKTLPSQYGHYFETTFNASYMALKNDTSVKEMLKSTNKVSRAFPGHQPELDSNQVKQTYNTYLSCSQDAYRPQH